MSRATLNLRLCAAIAAAWFMVAQASAHVGALWFPQLPAGVCSASATGDTADDGGPDQAHHLTMLAGHGLSCPLCAGPSTPPPPLVVVRVPAPICLFQLRAVRDEPAPILGREPVHVCARGPPGASAPGDVALVA